MTKVGVNATGPSQCFIDAGGSPHPGRAKLRPNLGYAMQPILKTDSSLEGGGVEEIVERRIAAEGG